MEDSGDWYDQTRKILIAAFDAGEIDYQKYVNLNQKALKKFLAMVGRWKNLEEDLPPSDKFMLKIDDKPPELTGKK